MHRSGIIRILREWQGRAGAEYPTSRMRQVTLTGIMRDTVSLW